MSFSQDQTELGSALQRGTAAVKAELRVNLCSGSVMPAGWLNIDINQNADIVLDLEKELLPLEKESVSYLACISAINYFEKERAQQIIRDVYRVLSYGGIVRFASQDLKVLARAYVEEDRDFWFEKNANGEDRYPGRTACEKLNEFFYGFLTTGHKSCKYVYDFETLKLMFEQVGFKNVRQMDYRDSELPDIEMLDNRPEQMFFLEACKPAETTILYDVESAILEEPISIKPLSCSSTSQELYEHGEDLWSHSREQAWQCYLSALHKDPDNEKVFQRIEEYLLNTGLFSQLVNLYEYYLKRKPADTNVQSKLFDARAALEKSKISSITLDKSRQDLDNLNKVTLSQMSREKHLQLAIDWLMRAQKVSGDGGVSAMYRLDERRWEVDYPETTGYIIATAIQYGRLLKDNMYLDKAAEMTRWECAIQDPDGGTGEPVGVVGKPPRVFNTSQVLLGWLSEYAYGNDPQLREVAIQSAIRAGDWLVGIQNEDGSWTTNTYQGARSYHVRTAWSLLDLYAATGDDRYLKSGSKFCEWLLKLATPNGWFHSTSLTDPGKPWTHLIGYTLVGLQKVCERYPNAIDVQTAATVLDEAAFNISEAYFARVKAKEHSGEYAGLGGTYDCHWKSTDMWSCLTGDTQIEFFLRSMARWRGQVGFAEVADVLLSELCNLQLVQTQDENIKGGLLGSYPIQGGYCAYAIPNWGVKFFADSLLQCILSNADDLKYLG